MLRFNRLFKSIHHASVKAYPQDNNPLTQTGAIANTTLIIAIITGILLLVWYRPSVHQAYDSVVSMEASPLLAELLRSLHRYSSDACMFFVLFHAMQLFFGRRFSGARWIAWVTGVLLITLLWSVGWTGYWLVWDERAQIVAIGSARVLDLLPVFADPLSRSFLTDSTIHSLFFFVIFFFHMVVPLGMGIALWIHIARTSRPNFITGKSLTIWITASLVALSLLIPADYAGPAKMLVAPSQLTLDWWYLFPIWIIENMGGGYFWALFIVSGLILYSLPFWRTETRNAPAEVYTSRCNACANCFEQCPFDAIKMVPRSDDMPYEAQSWVDVNKCVSCGICAGACDSSGIGLPDFETLDIRRQIEPQLKFPEGKRYYAFICREAIELGIDPVSGECKQLPDYYSVELPCVGWLHPLTVQRLFKRGAEGVLILSCADGDCRHREGPKWTKFRFSEEGYDFDPERLRLVELTRPSVRKVREAGRNLVAGSPTEHQAPSRKWIGSALATAALLAITFIPSNLPYVSAVDTAPQLIVSFKHAGELVEEQVELSAEEQANLPVHMRQSHRSTRIRAAVRLRVSVDGQQRIDRSYRPRGIMKDGNSIAVERLAVEPGEHLIEIEIGDSRESDEWQYRDSRRLQFTSGHRNVVLFDQADQFSWHTESD